MSEPEAYAQLHGTAGHAIDVCDSDYYVYLYGGRQRYTTQWHRHDDDDGQTHTLVGAYMQHI